MTDEEFIFHQTVRERKQAGYGDRHKKRQGGKTVRFPSDYKTKKEREAMNGECVRYDMGKPVKYEVFKVWPEDIQTKYIERLRDEYGASSGMIGQALGVSQNTAWRICVRLGIGLELVSKKNADGWDAFINGSERPQEAQEAEEVKVQAEEPEAPAEAVLEANSVPAAQEESKSLGIDALAALLASLKGSGARLTIEVTL